MRLSVHMQLPYPHYSPGGRLDEAVAPSAGNLERPLLSWGSLFCPLHLQPPSDVTLSTCTPSCFVCTLQLLCCSSFLNLLSSQIAFTILDSHSGPTFQTSCIKVSLSLLSALSYSYFSLPCQFSRGSAFPRLLLWSFIISKSFSSKADVQILQSQACFQHFPSLFSVFLFLLFQSSLDSSLSKLSGFLGFLPLF